MHISRLVPLAEKPPQGMMFPPPSFTTGYGVLGIQLRILSLPNIMNAIIPRSSILVSFNHMDMCKFKQWDLSRTVGL